jgi:RNA polymerase sigma factor (sigma-70 family)
MKECQQLQEYIECGSEAAFTELVRSHLDLVYSTARRLVQDSELAHDVCQAVFLRLARKARSIERAESLAGWLYRATRFEAANVNRSEQRRRSREFEAMRRAELDNEPVSAWASIFPVLEDAMATLKPQDQNAVVLRYFENQSLAQVGQALGINEDAARKRLSRSLEQLASCFHKRGVSVSAGSLASLLAANAVQSAPPGLAASLATTAFAGAAATTTGLLANLTSAIFMTKTTGTILAALAIGFLATPFLLKKNPAAAAVVEVNKSRPAERPSAPPQKGAKKQTTPAVEANRGRGPSLLERVASLPPLTAEQIETYVVANKRNAESLLAAYRVSTNLAYLTEAAQAFPGDPDVQYAVVASRAAPDVQRQWIEAYKTSSPDNALAWYFSGLEHYRTGDTNLAIAELLMAAHKPAFQADLAPTLQAIQEMHMSAGRTAEEARILAFQSSAMVPHLVQMRELATAMGGSIEALRRQNDASAVERIAGSGFVLGSHLSAGGGSQTLINQLVGIAIQKKFLDQFSGEGNDPFGRPITEARSQIENHRNALRERMKSTTALLAGLDDRELDNYMERVKLYGEEAALVWMKAKHE